jgi:myo-inositol-1(or 4)-monophosphatase
MALKSATINVMEAAARKAGRGLIRDFGEVEQLQVSRKGPADFVSKADLKAESILREELSKARPSFGLLMEESGTTKGTDEERRWIVDPLDGTTNFLHGIPHFAISIGLEERGEITAGVIYEPIRDELFWAEKGAGAYLNRRRIRVSSRARMGDAVLATGIPFANRPGKDEFVSAIGPIMEATAGVRRFGAASLDFAYVAAGRYEGFWEYGLSPWDVAAGIIVVREAGGLVGEIGGGANVLLGGSIIAANDQLYTPMQKLIRDSVRQDRPG